MVDKTIRNVRIMLKGKSIPRVNVYLTQENTNVKTFFSQPFAMSGDKLRDTGEDSFAQYRVQVSWSYKNSLILYINIDRLGSQLNWSPLGVKIMEIMKAFYPAKKMKWRTLSKLPLDACPSQSVWTQKTIANKMKISPYNLLMNLARLLTDLIAIFLLRNAPPPVRNIFMILTWSSLKELQEELSSSSFKRIFWSLKLSPSTPFYQYWQLLGVTLGFVGLCFGLFLELEG